MRDVRDVDEDEAAEDSGEDALEDGGFGSRIPKRVVWGVFLILLGLVGMLFIIKPKDPEFPNSVVQPVPQVRVAPADETSSVRVVLNTPATEAPEPGADLPMPLAEPSIPVKEPASLASSQGIGQAGERPAAPVQGSASKVVPSPTPQTQEAQKEAAKPAAEAERPGSLAAYKTNGEKFTLSVGSFKERKNAEVCKDDLEKKGLSPTIREVQIPGKGTWYRVSVGKFSSREEAQLLAKDVERKWQIKAFVAGLP
jgi:cell division septation protein DedD